MGIKGLNKFLKDYAKPVTLNEYRNKTFAIDVSIYIYKFKYGVNSTKQFVNRFRYQVNQFEKTNIKPIYVFDGPSPILKKGTQESRKKTQNPIVVTKEDITELKNYFDECGILYITAPSEAEKFCSYMTKVNENCVIFSNDMDSLVFGCTTLLTSSKEGFFEYNTKEILNKLELTSEEFIDLAIASGSDYFPVGVPGLGPKKALTYIKSHGKIEKWSNLHQDMTDSILFDIKTIFTDFSQEKSMYDTLVFEDCDSVVSDLESMLSIDDN